MVNQLLINDIDNCDVPDVNLLVTEDDTPVDNLASAKQQRLLVGSLFRIRITRIKGFTGCYCLFEVGILRIFLSESR